MSHRRLNTDASLLYHVRSLPGRDCAENAAYQPPPLPTVTNYPRPLPTFIKAGPRHKKRRHERPSWAPLLPILCPPSSLFHSLSLSVSSPIQSLRATNPPFDSARARVYCHAARSVLFIACQASVFALHVSATVRCIRIKGLSHVLDQARPRTHARGQGRRPCPAPAPSRTAAPR